MSPEEHSEFWRKVEFTVDRDVVRTDRSNSFFRGENNPNVEIMRSDPVRPFTFNTFAQPPPRAAVTFLPRHRGSRGAPFHFIFRTLGKLQMSFTLYWLLSTFDTRSKLMGV